MKKLLALSFSLLLIGLTLVSANPPSTFVPLLNGFPSIVSTWNTSDKGTNITLSNNNFDENGTTSSGVWNSVRATNPQTTGKLYGEMLLVTADSVTNGRFFFGVSTSAFVLSNLLGSTSTSAGDQDNTGWTASGMTIASNNIVSYNILNTIMSLAVDMSGKIWTGKCSGGTITWGSGGDPAIGTTPNITFISPLTLFLTASGFGDAGPAKIRLKSSSLNQSCNPPSGYSAWDG